MSEYDSTFAFADWINRILRMIDPFWSEKRHNDSIETQRRISTVRDALRRRFPADITLQHSNMARHGTAPCQLHLKQPFLFFFPNHCRRWLWNLGYLYRWRRPGILEHQPLGIGKSVMSIFLSYGLLLGFVGSGAGLVGGLIFVQNINEIAGVIETITGQEVFDPTVYYFNEIPTIIDPFTLTWVMLGAMGIAVIASVLPALRAARMHPVNALRFE